MFCLFLVCVCFHDTLWTFMSLVRVVTQLVHRLDHCFGRSCPFSCYIWLTWKLTLSIHQGFRICSVVPTSSALTQIFTVSPRSPNQSLSVTGNELLPGFFCRWKHQFHGVKTINSSLRNHLNLFGLDWKWWVPFRPRNAARFMDKMFRQSHRNMHQPQKNDGKRASSRHTKVSKVRTP